MKVPPSPKVVVVAFGPAPGCTRMCFVIRASISGEMADLSLQLAEGHGRPVDAVVARVLAGPRRTDRRRAAAAA